MGVGCLLGDTCYKANRIEDYLGTILAQLVLISFQERMLMKRVLAFEK